MTNTLAQVPTWELERLRPPSAAELLLEHRAGRDPNALLERFTGQYLAATRKDAATINAIVGDDAGPQRSALWDHLNQIAEDRREEWWVTPLKIVARLLAGASAAREVAEHARRGAFVGFVIRATTTVGRRQQARTRCARNEQRPRARRTGASSRTSSADPGGSGPHEPPAASLRLAPIPRAVLTFGCLTAEQRGEVSS